MSLVLMLTGTERADAKRKWHQQTAEVPAPGWYLPASPTLDIPTAALGDVRNIIQSPPSVETDNALGVARFLAFADPFAFSVRAQHWDLQEGIVQHVLVSLCCFFSRGLRLRHRTDPRASLLKGGAQEK